jgi:hypothetical protein
MIMGLDDVKSYMIGVILFILVIASGVFILGSFYSEDSSIDMVGQVSQFNSSLNLASNMTTAAQGVSDSIEKAGNSSSPLGWLDVLVGSTFTGLKAISGTMSFMNVAAAQSSSMFGIPSFVYPLLVLIILLIIAFAIWSAITRT